MRKIIGIILLCVMAVSVFTAFEPGYAQNKKKPAAQKSPNPDEGKIDTQKYPAAGVVVDGTLIKAGEGISLLWGVMGPPDKMNALRGKDSADQDYVKVHYYTYGVSFDVDNQKNLIKGILISSNERGVALKNCPFKVGQGIATVTKAWGEPEKDLEGLYAYWRRGVYVGVNSGKIRYIYITTTGQFEDDDQKTEGQ